MKRLLLIIPIVVVMLLSSCTVVREMSFNIQEPASLTDCDAAQFGLSPQNADNSSAMKKAFEYLNSHSSTRLVVKAGTYYFSSDTDMLLDGASNIEIDCNGAEFVFSTNKYFVVQNSNKIKFKDLIIDWNEAADRLASVVKIVAVNSDNSIDVQFTELDYVPVSAPWLTLNRLDDETLTPGAAANKEFWLDNAVESITPLEGNVAHIIHNGGLSGVRTGEYYLLRHYTYGGNVFNLGYTQNFTIENVKIYGAEGAGFCATDGTKNVAFIDFVIGLRPGTENKRRISTTVDGIHFSNSSGNILLDRCDISFTGDDCLNIHDNVGLVQEVNGNVIKIQCPATYTFDKISDTVGFLKSTYEKTDITATIENIVVNGSEIELTLSGDISKVKKGYIMFNTRNDSSGYIIKDSYFHECRARGLLLSAGNGIIKNNRFYRTQGPAVLLSTDIYSLWMEGAGVDNVVIKNNTFDSCDASHWGANGSGAVIEARSLYFTHYDTASTFTNISVINNTFKNITSNNIYIIKRDLVKEGNIFINCYYDR